MCTLFANLYVLLTRGSHMVYMGTPFLFYIYMITCGWLGCHDFLLSFLHSYCNVQQNYGFLQLYNYRKRVKRFCLQKWCPINSETGWCLYVGVHVRTWGSHIFMNLGSYMVAHIGTISNRYCERMWFLERQYYINLMLIFLPTNYDFGR